MINLPHQRQASWSDMIQGRASELDGAASSLRAVDCDELFRRAEAAQKAIESLLAIMPLSVNARTFIQTLLWMDKLGQPAQWVAQMYETLRQEESLSTRSAKLETP